MTETRPNAPEPYPHLPPMFAALRHRNFRLMWISLLVSNSGTWLQNVAQDYVVYRLTGRALDLGLVNGARAAPLICFSFFGGAIADRVDKRKLLIATQTTFAATAILLGALVQTHLVRVWHVVLMSFLGATVLSLDQPARQALLPSLVPRKDFANAIALNSVTFTGAATLGSALAGPVVGLFGIPAGFYLNAASFLAVIYAVWALQLPPMEKRDSEPPLDAVTSGLRFIGGSPLLLLLVSLLLVYSLCAMPYQSVLPVFAARVFGGGVRTLGYLRAAPGLGALTGGFLLAYYAQVRQKGWLAIGGGLGFSAALLLFCALHFLPIALVALFMAGMLSTVLTATVQTLMQHLTPDRMRGRVMSLFSVTVVGMWPLGALPLSWAADRFGVASATAGGALIAGAYALGAALFARRMIARIQHAELQDERKGERLS